MADASAATQRRAGSEAPQLAAGVPALQAGSAASQQVPQQGSDALSAAAGPSQKRNKRKLDRAQRAAQRLQLDSSLDGQLARRRSEAVSTANNAAQQAGTKPRQPPQSALSTEAQLVRQKSEALSTARAVPHQKRRRTQDVEAPAAGPALSAAASAVASVAGAESAVPTLSRKKQRRLRQAALAQLQDSSAQAQLRRADSVASTVASTAASPPAKHANGTAALALSQAQRKKDLRKQLRGQSASAATGAPAQRESLQPVLLGAAHADRGPEAPHPPLKSALKQRSPLPAGKGASSKHVHFALKKNQQFGGQPQPSQPTGGIRLQRGGKVSTWQLTAIS